MTPQRAILWIDHQSAKVLRLDAEPAAVETIRTHTHPTAQHGSAARTGHEYYGAVCDALEGLTQALVTGSRMALADFRRYVEKHRPQTAARIVAYTVLERATDRQLLADARQHFAQFDRLAATRLTPG
jgi:hypothetical protein